MSDVDLKEQLSAVAEVLEKHPDPEMTSEESNVAAAAVRASLEVVAQAGGECRQAVPYSPMQPVLDAGGVLRWCCNHTPEHCSVAQGSAEARMADAQPEGAE